jgi:D-aspartate ligase
MNRRTSATPALLLMPEFAGTLAAARCLAGHGVPVHVAAHNRSAPAYWSRFVSKRLRGPSFCNGPEPIVKWLLQRRSEQCREVLYPTCDEMAWLLARHRDALAPHYYLYSPDFSAIRSILDKRALYQVCREVGIDVPETWYPETESELERVIRLLPDCLIKPRTQTFYNAHAKGDLARGESDLRLAWQCFRAAEFAPDVVAEVPDIGIPMVQQYVSVKTTGVLSVSGFIDQQGRLLASRGSRKILQCPPYAGIGLCFEAVEPPEQTVEMVCALCRKLGFHGVFEVEFLQSGQRHLLIDFNPRYFGQMGLDIARGMELPWLAHLCALGDEQAAIAAAQAADCSVATRPHRFHNQIALSWRLATGSVFGVIGSDDRRRWREWMKQSSGRSVDAFLRRDDLRPGVAMAATILHNALRYPRGFWRSLQQMKNQ